MCNRRVVSEWTQVDNFMDSPTLTPRSRSSSNEDSPRVKFLCSFSGSILPRPQDGKLRYVGGETRIVSVPRDIGFEELMGRMKDLYEAATILKYQQPDEDLDALVSVVNDDDVTNMMEEYDKLTLGDGFTRLRVFLFSSLDQDDSLLFIDGDERDKERRYVDALNSLNESTDLGKLQIGEFQGMGPIDDTHLAEQYHSQMNQEGSFHNQRNYEMLMPQVNLRHLTIPHLSSLQHQQSGTQRYAEMEPPWSPAYYSPRHLGHLDPRQVAEFPPSPSSARYYTPYGGLQEKVFDRVPDEYNRQQVNNQSSYEQPCQTTENAVWLHPLSGDKAGFPGNILQGSATFEGNSVCEHCRSPFPRNAYPDSSWKQGEHPELPNIDNGSYKVANPCAECPIDKETYVPNAEAKFQHSLYNREQSDPRFPYNETKTINSGSVRLNDHYIVDGNGMNIALGPGKLPDGHYVSSPYLHYDDRQSFVRHGPEFVNEVFRDQSLAPGSSHIHLPLEERGVRYGNIPHPYGPEYSYQPSHGHVPPHVFWRNAQTPVHEASSFEPSGLLPHENGNGFIRGTMEGNPSFRVGMENGNQLVEYPPKMGLDNLVAPDYSHGHALKLVPSICGTENQQPMPVDSIQLPASLGYAPKESLLCSVSDAKNSVNVPKSARAEEKSVAGGGQGANSDVIAENFITQPVSSTEQKKNAYRIQFPEVISSGGLPTRQAAAVASPIENTALEQKELQVEISSSVPKLAESLKKGALEVVEEVKAEIQEKFDALAVHVKSTNEEPKHESETLELPGDLEVDSDIDNQRDSKIEPTKAEEEAIARGLQTIKNDDLEEIRELGSGTYGAVYHGKWKGSDVAIKRIKASCFTGRPSDRERLIADFWKEALILSSLHHPNVVSFYGIVRDGPDGSLATVTEFMINGSLKQFLQKKDRTIDRRKRLIIAMDAAFGMEYLHGKNIVHFDLKCENLLVNMRDPHRPVCKIGDLGLSKVKQHTLVSGGVRGTLPWMAPELLSGKSNMVTEKIDVYSFGIVMWELLTGEEPYADRHCASIIGGIVNNTLRPQIPTWCDPEWKSLMESSWSSDPAQRPSFSEISQRLRSMAAAINLK